MSRLIFRPIKGAIEDGCKRKGLTQATLGEELGVSRQYVSRVLTGHEPLSFDFAARIAVALEMDITAVVLPVTTEFIEELAAMLGLRVEFHDDGENHTREPAA